MIAAHLPALSLLRKRRCPTAEQHRWQNSPSPRLCTSRLADVKAYAGKPLIHWSIDTLDWSTRNSSSTISSVLNNVRDGSIVLMHDIYAPTRDAAVSLIPTLISRGYQLVTVSEMAAYRGVTLQDGTIYYSIR